VLFKGHVGIVSGKGIYYGSQRKTGPKEIGHGLEMYWGKDRPLIGVFWWRG